MAVTADCEQLEVERPAPHVRDPVGRHRTVDRRFVDGAHHRLVECGLDVRIAAKPFGLLAEDEVCAHAAACELPHAFLGFGAVRVRVEVPHAGPLRVFEQLHEIERVADAFRAEPKILVVLPDHLRVQIDVEEFVLPQRLRDAVVEREARHRLVRELGIEPDHLGPLEH